MPRFAFVCIAALTVAGPAAAQPMVATFDELPLPGANTFNNNAGVVPPPTPSPIYYTGSFVSGGATFNTAYNPVWGTWAGWSYSNITNTNTTPDPMTPDYTKQYNAYAFGTGGAGAPTPGSGGSSSPNYAVGYVDTYSGVFPTIQLPGGHRPVSIQVTNTTYVAEAVLHGDDFFPVGHKGYQPGDFLTLTISGQNAIGQPTGSIDFHLADYRGGKTDLVSNWTTVDLSSFAPDTTRLAFSLTTAAGDYYTPTYFAVDNLVTTPVPEPAVTGLVGAGGLVLWRLWRRRSTAAGARATGQPVPPGGHRVAVVPDHFC